MRRKVVESEVWKKGVEYEPVRLQLYRGTLSLMNVVLGSIYHGASHMWCACTLPCMIFYVDGSFLTHETQSVLELAIAASTTGKACVNVIPKRYSRLLPIQSISTHS